MGGGFGGLAVARGLGGSAVDVTLIDKRNFHLFQPLLYQVATGALSPANIATPLRWSLRRYRNVDIVLGEVTGFDVDESTVELRGDSIRYDHLVVASGATHSYFGNDWSGMAPGLKSLEDALEIRRRVLLAFERADRARDPSERAALLTFVIVGGGPTGIELAGALAEIAHHTLSRDFRHIDPSEARIMLVDAAEHVLSAYPRESARQAKSAVEELGVEVRVHTRVTSIRQDAIDLETEMGTESISAGTILWAAGVQASSLGKSLADPTGTAVDRAGRVRVSAELTLAGYHEISVIGDLAACANGESGSPLPGIAPVAMQQGTYVAERILAEGAGRQMPSFHYRDRGMLATIGRGRAVAALGRARLSGLPAWLIWIFVHLRELARADNRVLVFVQWAWSYLTYERSARLITNADRDSKLSTGTRNTRPDGDRGAKPHASPP